MHHEAKNVDIQLSCASRDLPVREIVASFFSGNDVEPPTAKFTPWLKFPVEFRYGLRKGIPAADAVY